MQKYSSLNFPNSLFKGSIVKSMERNNVKLKRNAGGGSFQRDDLQEMRPGRALDRN
jgi:hypothetical protein